jgi:hypothetical protein
LSEDDRDLLRGEDLKDGEAFFLSWMGARLSIAALSFSSSVCTEPVSEWASQLIRESPDTFNALFS